MEIPVNPPNLPTPHDQLTHVHEFNYKFAKTLVNKNPFGKIEKIIRYNGSS